MKFEENKNNIIKKLSKKVFINIWNKQKYRIVGLLEKSHKKYNNQEYILECIGHKLGHNIYTFNNIISDCKYDSINFNPDICKLYIKHDVKAFLNNFKENIS